MPSFFTKPPTSEAPSTRSEVSDTGNVTRSPQRCASRPRILTERGRRYNCDALRAHVRGITAVERAGEEQRVEALVLGRGRRGRQAEQQGPPYGAPKHHSILVERVRMRGEILSLLDERASLEAPAEGAQIADLAAVTDLANRRGLSSGGWAGPQPRGSGRSAASKPIARNTC